MAISFQNIPANIRVPFFYGEVKAGVQGFQSDSTLLLIHLKNDAGTAVADRIYNIFGNEDQLFGADSPIAQMIKTARKNAPFQTIAAAGQAQISGGTAAVGSVTFNATAARAYTASLYVVGKLVRCPMASGDTAAQQATKLAAAVTAAQAGLQLPLSAAVNGGTPAKVDFTAKLKGVHGNDLRLETDLALDDDPLFGASTTIVQPTGGVGDADISAVLVNASDIEYDWIGLGYNDTANIGRLEAFLDDVNGRWGPNSQLYGHGFWSKSDTPGNLSTLGLSRNSQHVSPRGQYNYVTPAYIGTAALAARAASELSTFPDGSRPLQTLRLFDVIGPKNRSDRFSVTTRNTLYYDGMSADAYDSVGNVMIDRVVTSYQKNAYGSPDQTFLDVNTPAQVMYALRRFRADMTQTYGRVGLVDENPFGLDSVVTTEDLRKQFIHTYEKLVQDGCMENADLFAAGLQVERDVNDPNRVNASLPLDTVNQLRIMAVSAVTYLQLQAT